MTVSSRREKFFRVALELIHEKGFKATTMRSIAERLQCDVANIYNYIPSKHALLESFLFNISASFHQGIDHILSSHYAPTEKLKAVLALNIRLTQERPFEVALLVNEWRNLKETKIRKFVAERDAYEAKVAQILTAGIDSGEFAEMDLEIMKYAVLSCMRWLYAKYTDTNKQLNPIELERQLWAFILKGVKP